jgi:hypothetical protein
LRQVRRQKSETALDNVDELLIGNLGALGLEKHGEVHEPVRAYVLLKPLQERVAAEVSACF